MKARRKDESEDDLATGDHHDKTKEEQDVKQGKRGKKLFLPSSGAGPYKSAIFS